MKRINLIAFSALILLITQSNVVISQDYIPMNFEDGVWIEHYIEEGGYREFTQKICNGDTLINNDLYYKLYETKVKIYYNRSNDTIRDIYLGLIGNFSDKTVKYIPKDSIDPVTIYDFNLKTGDTIKGAVDNFVIREIDSTEICGRYHKRYNQTEGAQPAETLIEGIGFSNGLLGYFSYFDLGGETNNMLWCYSEWTNKDCSPCEYIEGILVQKSGIQIYPNPFTDQIRIQSPKPIIQIKIYDMLGHDVFTENPSYYDNELLELNHLMTGFYLMRIQFNDHSFYSLPILKN